VVGNVSPYFSSSTDRTKAKPSAGPKESVPRGFGVWRSFSSSGVDHGLPAEEGGKGGRDMVK
jgi:hypothetical protein